MAASVARPHDATIVRLRTAAAHLDGLGLFGKWSNEPIRRDVEVAQIFLIQPYPTLAIGAPERCKSDSRRVARLDYQSR